MDADGLAMTEALREAQLQGFAEQDASTDLDGDDARAKLAILCALAFGVRVGVDDIPTRSAAHITHTDFVRARAAAAMIRQLEHAEYDRERATLTAWVASVTVERDS